MSYTSGFFDAVDQGGGNYDRVYSAGTFAHYFNLLVKNGVFPDPSTGLQVRASSVPDMHVSVSPGSGWINGYYITVPAGSPEELTVPTANPSLSRIDSVIMGLNYVEREVQLYIKSGAVSASPVAVTLQRDNDLYELELAQISIPAGLSSIAQASITDMRTNSSRCGIVKGTIDQIDTTELFAQYDDAFQTWFADIQVQLSGDVATKLQNQVNQLKTDKVSVSDKATTQQAQVGTDNTKWMTPKTTQDALSASKVAIKNLEQDVANLKSTKQDLDHRKGYLRLSATYASTGIAASNVLFSGVPDTDDPSLLITDKDGVFFGEFPAGTYTLVFTPIAGQAAIPNTNITLKGGEVTSLNISLTAGVDTRSILSSGNFLVGLDCKTLRLCGLGGGGSGGGGGYASSYRGASAGGGGGYITEISIDPTPYLGKLLMVTIGSGGIGGKSDRLTGNSGGTTKVTAPNGTVLLTASGGAGGEGRYSGTTATGGSGTGKGASVTGVSTSAVSFDTTDIDGAYPFGNSSYPRVGGGGAATGRYSSNYDQFSSAAGAGGGGLNTSGTNGLGGGGSGRLTANNYGNFYNGGSGALFMA